MLPAGKRAVCKGLVSISTQQPVMCGCGWIGEVINWKPDQEPLLNPIQFRYIVILGLKKVQAFISK